MRFHFAVFSNMDFLKLNRNVLETVDKSRMSNDIFLRDRESRIKIV